jgi:hypothetical protein
MMGKSLEHMNCKVKKETAKRAVRRPPSILTDGKNGRRMLCDVYNVHEEPVVGGRNPLKKKVREIWYILEY